MSGGNDFKTEFRKALGAFPTGVTIVTTKDPAGKPVGVTANSFNSVSLDPPLVLWPLAKSSLSREAFCSSGHFAIHVLAEAHEQISNRFAKSGADKFDGVEWSDGALGSPLLNEHAALFECRTKYQYEGGDHVILVGEVIRFEARDEAPLVFHGGRYAERRLRPARTEEGTVDLAQGRYTDDFLFYLLARAHFQTSRPSRTKMRELGLTQDEYLVLVALSMRTPAGSTEIREFLEHTGHSPTDETLEAMATRGLLQRQDSSYSLAPEAREKFIDILATSQAFESEIADKLSRGELAELKQLLRRIIEITGKDVPLAQRE